ncbi:MAG: MBL fold metallo-hydrolase [Verrucomicrobia bacterium]|nr:MBL fold metallo-hydrolase [Verrucomicrobiota bacterium]
MQIPIDSSACADQKTPDAENKEAVHSVGPDLGYQRLAIVNVAYCGLPGAKDRQWVLIDCGVIGTAGLIVRAAENLFGPDSRPSAILLTHGHFDHVGALKELCRKWDCSVYAHKLEIPYLNGQQSYPPPDPKVGGGLMAALSPLYPRGPIDVTQWLKALPDDGMVPDMPEWSWIHTPGHSPGHVSFWRESDRSLIAGDAFITTDQESAYAVAIQRLEMHGPPQYYTPDWNSARISVEKLAALEPELAITGHGKAVAGKELRRTLHLLVDNFEAVAVPQQGR